MSASKKTTAKKTTSKKAAQKRDYNDNPVVIDRGIQCPHCGEKYGHRVTNTWPNGRKRRLCGGCGMPFASWREPTMPTKL